MGHDAEGMLLRAVVRLRKSKDLVEPESHMGLGDGVIGSRPQTRSSSPRKKGGEIPKSDKAEMRKLIDDAVAQCPEGYSREVSVSVTIKGGVKLTTLEIHDTNLKNGRVSTKYQKFGNKAGMKGNHAGKLK
jgi:hypothetical protein